MPRQYWQELIAWATTSGTAIANTGTETILIPDTTIAANYLADGRTIRIWALGGYGTTGTPTLQFALRWGGVAATPILSQTGAIVTASGVGGGASMTALWEAVLIMQVRVNGSSGSLMTNGHAILHTSTVPTAGTVTNYGLVAPFASGSGGGLTPVAVTASLIADTALSFTAKWGTPSASNSIQCHQFMLEVMN